MYKIAYAEERGKIAEHDIFPEIATTIIVETQNAFDITTQNNEVDNEKHMISDETIIPASISNHINKIWKKIKEIFHKNPPTRIAITKRTESEGRTLWDTYNQVGFSGIVVVAGILYLLTRGK